MNPSQPLASLLDDAPCTENALPGFEGYVNTLAGILMDPDIHTPLTLGVFGAWGSGKTSLMLQVKDKVTGGGSGRAGHRAVWFNAWKYNQEDALWRALLLVLLDDLETLIPRDRPPADADGAEPEQLLALLRQALYRDTSWSEKGERRPDWTTALTAGAQLAFNLALSGASLGLADTVVDEARKALGKGEPVSRLSQLAQAFKREEIVHEQAQLRSLEQFQANFARLVEMLVRREGREDRKLVIFVDDLDRCTPDKAVQVLEALKLFLDVSGCITVLALSAQEIENAVLMRYQGKVDPKAYLEKIIQVPFILPPIENEAMRQYVTNLAPSLPADCAEVFAKGLAEPNPRQVKRVLNIFLLLNRLLAERPDLRRSITPVRLATFVTIQHAHPEFYELLRRRNPGYLPELAQYFRTVAEREARTVEDRQDAPELPEALRDFQTDGALRRLLCLFEEEEARFDALTPLDVRSYITLTKRSTPLEAPVVRSARLTFEPELVTVPAGAFWMGTSDPQVEALRARYEWAKDFDFGREQPQRELTLPEYQIGRYPVTNAEYAAFVRATGHRPPSHWRGDTFPEEQASHPVVYVTWHDALAYVQWLRERTGQDYRLPTEAEWEKAARGTDGRLWPWGDDWDAERCNMKIAGPGETTPVGQYAPRSNSPYGCADMAGNVWEWCSTLYEAYPYRQDDGRENLEASGGRVVRGGCWYDDDPGWVRCAFRVINHPGSAIDDSGFRVARGSRPSHPAP
jgi:formylglycine-generating enzyme required for sulfatase activity